MSYISGQSVLCTKLYLRRHVHIKVSFIIVIIIIIIFLCRSFFFSIYFYLSWHVDHAIVMFCYVIGSVYKKYE